MTDEMSELSEIKALLQHQIQASESRHVENVKDRAEVRVQLQEVRGSLTGVANKVVEIDQRLSKNEKLTMEASNSARKALNAQSDLEGSLLREVGALAANDKAQNAALTAIKSETHEQSRTLDVLAKAEATRETRERIVYWAITKGVPMLWAASLALAGAFYALSGHIK